MENEEDNNRLNLESCYKHVYVCDTPECSRVYGSDKEEEGKHICPVCEGKVK